MNLEEKQMIETFGQVTTAVDIAISDEIGLPLPLSAKLFESALYTEKKESYSVFHMLPENWGLGDTLYQELMEFLANQDERQYAYAQLDRETLKLTKFGNTEAYELSILKMNM